MTEEKSQAVELAEIREQLKEITRVLALQSEANGCAMDALLALLPTLGPSGLLEKKEDGSIPFLEALKAQHAQLHTMNSLIAQLIKRNGMENESIVLTPAPEA